MCIMAVGKRADEVAAGFSLRDRRNDEKKSFGM